MFEQFGPYYRQNASEIQDPTNCTYERLWRDLAGTFWIRHCDGTDELFSNAIGSGTTVGDFANVGWTNNNNSMNVTPAYQIITGAAATRFSSSGSFTQTAPDTLSLTYTGPNNAQVRLEMDETHTGTGSGVFTYAIFKNGVIIPDSEFQQLFNVSRNIARTITVQTGVNTGDVFDIRVMSAAPVVGVFRYISFVATKQKQS